MKSLRNRTGSGGAAGGIARAEVDSLGSGAAHGAAHGATGGSSGKAGGMARGGTPDTARAAAPAMAPGISPAAAAGIAHRFPARARALALAIALAAASAAFAACESIQAAQQGSAAPAALTAVEVLEAAPADIAREMAYAGKVVAGQSLSVMSKLAGKVSSVEADIGDRVAAGDVLMRLDEQDVLKQIDQLGAQLLQAEQGIKSAENGLASVTGGQYQSAVLQQETSISGYDKQIENARIALDTAALAVENAQRAQDSAQMDYDSTKALFDQGMAAQNDMNRIELALEQAKAGRTQAANALSQAQVAHDQLVQARQRAGEALGITRGQIVSDNTRQAELAVEQARAAKNVLEVQLANVRSSLGDAAVTSPISGVVSARSAQAGEFVSQQLPAFTVVAIDVVKVDVSVSELLINSIAAGDKVGVYIHALGSESFPGTIATVSPAADQTGTFPVKIEIPNPDGRIKPGMFAEARFVKDASRGAVVLPRGAVVSSSAGDYVYIVRDGVASRSPVELGIDNGSEAEILSGVGFGDSVVVKGQTGISDGERVNVVNAAAVVADAGAADADDAAGAAGAAEGSAR
ncbi:MAG: efflux RND transporter periplasmic adaptor subunit [Clostridiales bacterium]|jgi:RND family efflux transporter MFP subunit|nr:efflux RND transporter periplasmic adaptor subunit [Clostridiales bacterium]